MFVPIGAVHVRRAVVPGTPFPVHAAEPVLGPISDAEQMAVVARSSVFDDERVRISNDLLQPLSDGEGLAGTKAVLRRLLRRLRSGGAIAARHIFIRWRVE